MEYTFSKVCKCSPATASTNMMRTRQFPPNLKTGLQTVQWWLIPGPSCDVCGKAWRKRKKAPARPSETEDMRRLRSSLLKGERA